MQQEMNNKNRKDWYIIYIYVTKSEPPLQNFLALRRNENFLAVVVKGEYKNAKKTKR